MHKADDYSVFSALPDRAAPREQPTADERNHCHNLGAKTPTAVGACTEGGRTPRLACRAMDFSFFCRRTTSYLHESFSSIPPPLPKNSKRR